MSIDGKWMFNETRGGAWGGDKYDTREEAIAAGRKAWPGEDFYVGQCEQIEVPVEADAEQTIELIGGRIDDLYGGCDVDLSECFHGEVTGEMEMELQRELEAVVKEWIKKHKICEECFVIHDAERVAVEDQY